MKAKDLEEDQTYIMKDGSQRRITRVAQIRDGLISNVDIIYWQYPVPMPGLRDRGSCYAGNFAVKAVRKVETEDDLASTGLARNDRDKPFDPAEFGFAIHDFSEPKSYATWSSKRAAGWAIIRRFNLRQPSLVCSISWNGHIKYSGAWPDSAASARVILRLLGVEVG